MACALAPAASPSAATDITFFAVSDTHYGREYGSPFDSLRLATVGHINALPGTPYPTSVGGGPVAVPRGIVMPGDLVDRSYLTRWKMFEADYGVNGEGRVRFPVYDGLGNHDVYNYGFDGKTDVITKAFIARNAKRMDLANLDERRYHYSWDWDQVHFVQLNLFAGFEPGPAPLEWDPVGSLEFLRKDLEAHVGKSGRPVLVSQHFQLDTSQYYSSNAQKEAFVDLLKQYNCIGVLHGHTHVEAIYKYRDLDVFSDGAAFKGDILIFRILEGRMFVVHRHGDAWGRLKFEKAISMGAPMPLVAPVAAEPRSTRQRRRHRGVYQVRLDVRPGLRGHGRVLDPTGFAGFQARDPGRRAQRRNPRQSAAPVHRMLRQLRRLHGLGHPHGRPRLLEPPTGPVEPGVPRPLPRRQPVPGRSGPLKPGVPRHTGGCPVKPFRVLCYNPTRSRKAENDAESRNGDDGHRHRIGTRRQYPTLVRAWYYQ